MDIGSISTKAVVLDPRGKSIASAYLATQGDPILAVGRLLEALKTQVGEGVSIYAVGTTGSARRLVGAMLEANEIKNEITAHAVGTLSRYPEVRTILEIGGQDSKIILLQDGVVVDYAMNTLCAAGTGAFLSAQAGRLGLAVEDMGPLALQAKNPTRIAARCTVFAESDLIHKAQVGHTKADLVAGLCTAVASNYLNNVGKGKNLSGPIIFQGGVSRNVGVVDAFKRELGQEIMTDPQGHLFGAIGAAVLAQNAPQRTQAFSFDLVPQSYQSKAQNCKHCPNCCEVIYFYKGDSLLDFWGNRCDRAGQQSAS